jgi:hypothetical protein
MKQSTGIHAVWVMVRSNPEYIQTLDSITEDAPEYTGGSVSYYSVEIENPTSEGVEPYTAECNDIIEALGMNYADGNAFKVSVGCAPS